MATTLEHLIQNMRIYQDLGSPQFDWHFLHDMGGYRPVGYTSLANFPRM